ncbi:hypothetical protein J3R30DRAFT_3284694 [Lentinula aciculospora]|uniref:RING-type E3 ubiquitin transferase n=1 Tax=Lentinula aciculospora TaxID=153920 RepID=A0A9W9AIQ2_9AGAR|nr:hypothetical protein J3R30DRAFT_3284694 [Lentinula aciculospora]
MASPVAGPSTVRKLTGSTPGILDPTQRDRLLTLSQSTLSFASFNPRTATSSHSTPDARNLSLNEELYNPKRIVIETYPSGETFWRFVPKTRLDEGVVDEGNWPRVVDICGTPYECSQDQWDIYKLDPLYECRVHAPPSLSTITRSPHKSPDSPYSNRKRTSTKAGIPQLNPRKKLHTSSENSSFDLGSDSDEVEEVEDMVIDQSMPPPPRARSASLRRKQPGEDIFRNTFTYEQTAQRKRTRKASPGAAKRKLDIKRAKRERRRHDRQQAKIIDRRQEWHEQFMQEVYAEVPDIRPPSTGYEDESLDGEPSPDTSFDEEAARAAAIAESRRKLAELEVDRPLWEEEARKRALRQKAEEESQRLRAEERQWSDMKRAEAEAPKEQQDAELREHTEREEAAKRQRERRHREQRWAYGPWTSIRALERYKVLSEAFDATKFNVYDPLTFHVIPWPLLIPPAKMSVEDVDWNAVENFFDAVRPHMRSQDFKAFVEKSQRRFHPDRWRSRGLLRTVVDEAERGCLEVGNTRPGPSQASSDNFTSSTVITIPKLASCGPRSAGPSFNSFDPESIPERREDQVTTYTPSEPQPPPPAVLHSLAAAAPTNVPTNNTAQGPQLRRHYPPNHWTIARVLRFFGYGNNASKARRQLVSLICCLGWGFAQVCLLHNCISVIFTFTSPTVPGANEWTACERPLGVWSCLWLARVIVACMLAYWGWTRDRFTRTSRPDPESGQNASRASDSEHSGQIRPRNSQRSVQDISPPGNSPQTQNVHLHHTAVFRRLSLFSSMYSLTWFLTAHILVYTSIKTCRFSSPHIWWLVFGILCITYLMILEVIILGLIVFVFAPVVFLMWNILLVCIGRHPLQNPHMIKPEIGKLPKNLVERIPLVMYIPPPPDALPTEGPIQIPANIYSYPPKSPLKGINTPAKKRFKFIKIRKSSPKPDKTPTDCATDNSKQRISIEHGSWENNWDTEGYPHVVLDDNRAACAICLLDFEEPKRLHPVGGRRTKAVTSEPKGGEVTVEVISEEERENDELRLADAGEGAQPLRLLRCGHVFHKTCLDPWLIEVSGRCPVCQRPVEMPEPEEKKARRW